MHTASKISLWTQKLYTSLVEISRNYIIVTSPGDKAPHNSSGTATYHPSRKLSKLDELDMRDTAGEVGTDSQATYSCGPLHMGKQR